MSRATPDDQLKFLLNCVRHSNNGKVGRVMFFSHWTLGNLSRADRLY